MRAHEYRAFVELAVERIGQRPRGERPLPMPGLVSAHLSTAEVDKCAENKSRCTKHCLRGRCDEDAEGVACWIRENVERFDRIIEAVVQQTSAQ